MILFSVVKTQHGRRSRSLQRLRVACCFFLFFLLLWNVSYHHDICAEGLSKSNTHELIVKPSPGSAACRAPLLGDTQIRGFRRVLHSVLSSCPVLLLHAAVQTVGFQLKQPKQRSGFMRSLPCDPSPHFSLSPVPSSPPLHSRLIVSRSLCLCPSFCLCIPVRTR